ncbi:SUF system Fe-S cluster assembly protein [Parvularcula sp. IMCC14364]|uniref:SUF system Fe-S cluster assembly protein n=1 Tax=Parvularcula sp. IMCC14364 TaxID=3067902 RepID=UPI002741FFE6|nr:SUF system Fe-S cluster assembly protein [Parvularcula sp. IMCC14364]
MSEVHDIIDLSGGNQSTASAGDAAAVAAQPELDRITADIVKALKSVYDPEIPVDIYELGLIYRVDYEPEGENQGLVVIDMTLTAPGCPVAGEMPIWVQNAVTEVEGVKKVVVEMVFEPPWTPERMSEEAKLELGWM